VWTYSGDPLDGGVDEVRFLVGDTNVDDQLISNEGIEYIIARWTPVYGDGPGSALVFAAMAAEQIAATFTSEVSYSADGVSIGVNELQDKYNALALSLRDQHKQYDVGGGPDVGGIMYSQYPDPTVKPTLFAVGMNDNPSAGNQSYDGPFPVSIPEVDY
jgi:hypothetical protein